MHKKIDSQSNTPEWTKNEQAKWGFMIDSTKIDKHKEYID